MGAIAEDCSFDLPRLRKVYAEHIGPWMARFGPPLPNSTPKTRLKLFMAAKGCRLWTIARAHEDTPGRRSTGAYCRRLDCRRLVLTTDVIVHDKVVANASGPHVHEAIARASEIALEELLSRIDTLCACGSALARID